MILMVEKKSVDKWKTKKWFSLIAPSLFDMKVLGETPAQKEQQVINRTVELNLSNLTGNKQLRYVKAKFKVKRVEGLKAYTEIVGHEIMRNYINKMIRRRKSKIETISFVNTADNKKMKIKVITITARKASIKKEKDIRRKMTEYINEISKQTNFMDIMNSIFSGKMNEEIFKQVKDIVPIQRVEIIKSELLEG